jgi:fructuronate reductase
MDMSGSPFQNVSGIGAAASAAPCSVLQPGIVHFGTGRRFRGAVAPLIDRVRLYGHWDYGIIAVSQSDGPVFHALQASGGKYQIVERGGSEDDRAQVASIVGVLSARSDRQAVIRALADPRISLVTLTLGPDELHLTSDGRLNRDDPDIAREMAGCPDPVSPIGQLVAGLAARRAEGLGGVRIFNCDNAPGSNLAMASLVDEMAVERDVQLADWIAVHVRFPAVYGDRLVLDASDLEQNCPSDIATESFIHWVVENDLGSEREALGDVGVSLVRDVRPFLVARERLLEGSLCLLGFAGLLQGYSQLDEVMADPKLHGLLDHYLAESSAVLPPVKGFDADRYLTDLKLRYANPALTMPLWRLAANGSRKMPVRVIPTIIDAMRQNAPADAPASTLSAWLIHCMSPDNRDDHAAHFWSLAEQAGDDWPLYVELACGFEPVFGSLGKNKQFQQLVTRSVRLLPGLASLVDG